MNNTYIFSFLLIAFVSLHGCSIAHHPDDADRIALLSIMPNKAREWLAKKNPESLKNDYDKSPPEIRRLFSSLIIASVFSASKDESVLLRKKWEIIIIGDPYYKDYCSYYDSCHEESHAIIPLYMSMVERNINIICGDDISLKRIRDAKDVFDSIVPGSALTDMIKSLPNSESGDLWDRYPNALFLALCSYAVENIRENMKLELDKRYLHVSALQKSDYIKKFKTFPTDEEMLLLITHLLAITHSETWLKTRFGQNYILPSDIQVIGKVVDYNYDKLKDRYPYKETDDAFLSMTLYEVMMDYLGFISARDIMDVDAHWNKEKNELLWYESHNGAYVLKVKKKNAAR